MEKYTVIDNFIEQRYELDLGDDAAFVEYNKAPGLVILTHAYVPAQHEGKGIAAEMVRHVLEDIRSKGLQVVPQCTYIAQYICRHPEWEELIDRKKAKKS